MARPAVRVGDINSYGAPVIATKAVNILIGASPAVVAGSPVAPHDEKPTHVSVTTTTQPRVLLNAVPITTVGTPDTCFHVRVTGDPSVLF